MPVKQASRLDDEVELDGSATLDGAALEWDLNEWDAFSLEVALQLAEADEGSEVVVATVARDEGEDGLLSCLAMGADRAIHVDDPALETADPLVIAHVLAAVARREAPDLVLCGVQSSDTAQATTGAALAGLLDFTRVAVVRAVEMSGGYLVVERELEGGTVEVLRLRPPALLTIQTGINEPRYATLRAIKQASAKPYEKLGIADVGLNPADVERAAGSRNRSLSRRPLGARATMLDGPPEQLATQIIQIVQEAMEG